LQILELRNSIRDYAWGSTTLIPDLLGIENPDAAPQAEMWLGAHPGAPSAVRIGNAWVSLSDWIRDDPVSALGQAVSARFAGKLPYLLKVLAAAEPLSLQAHPDPERARAGFQREDALGIDRNAPERSYRDSESKPELLCALTPFEALLGFREVAEISENFEALALEELAGPLARLAAQGSVALPAFFRSLLELDPPTCTTLLQAARSRSDALREQPQYRWLHRLADRYPADAGALAPLYLNLVRLEPGEAIFLPAGELHSYLEGCGIEIMASSDNVLRGGLTSKHVDRSELLEVLTFATGPPEIIHPVSRRADERVYQTAAREFELSQIELDGDWSTDSSAGRRPAGPEILLCVEGRARLSGEGEPEISIERGQSCFVLNLHNLFRLKLHFLVEIKRFNKICSFYQF
jgi:mannose-6-phosphate isomerase